MAEKISYPMLEKLYNILSKLYNSIVKLSGNVEKITGRTPEIIVSLLYAVLHFVISFFHEPWYDEAVAWQIAKCASVKDILFTLPHYEGHPPLWHLILLPFAKLGCPYEFSLSLVSLVFAGASVLLIIWKAPFPRIIRLLMPFTYFLFYQYGVISRPYCVMTLAFILCAITFKERDNKPWPHILSLMLLCLASAYGILFAGGITIAWLLGLLKKDGFRFLLDKKRTLALFCLLALAIVLILEIFPASDTFAIVLDKLVPKKNSLLARLAYTFLALPADSFITNIYSKCDMLSYLPLQNYSMIPGIIIGIFIWIVAIYFTKKRGTLLTLIIPYSIFAVFSAVKYFYLHHIGIGFIFALFCIWSSCNCNTVSTDSKNTLADSIIKYVSCITCVLFIAVSLYWNISASVCDIIYQYDSGKEIANYISDNNLDDYKIFVPVEAYYEFDENDNITDNIIDCTFNQSNSDSVLAYFDRNIFLNLNDGRDDMAYSFHKFSGLAENAELIEKWRGYGAPDVVYAQDFNVDIVYEDIADPSDYVMVYFSEYSHLWKGKTPASARCLFVRKELVEELGLKRAFE